MSLFTISSYFPREAGAKVPNGSIGDFAGGIRYDVQVVLSTFHEMIFSKEIIFLRGEGIGIFYTCEVFDVFELFEVRGGIKYS